MALAAIVEHGKAVIVTFDKNTDDGGDPSDHRKERKDENGNGIDHLPAGVAKGQPDTPDHVLDDLLIKGNGDFFTLDKGFRLFREIGEERRTDNKKQVFEQGEIKKDKGQPYHDPPHHKEKAKDRALLVMQETLDADHPAKPGHGRIGGIPEEQQPDKEQDRIKDAGEKDPFPQLVPADKMMSPDVRLKGYDDLFEQGPLLFVYFG